MRTFTLHDASLETDMHVAAQNVKVRLAPDGLPAIDRMYRNAR